MIVMYLDIGIPGVHTSLFKHKYSCWWALPVLFWHVGVKCLVRLQAFFVDRFL